MLVQAQAKHLLMHLVVTKLMGENNGKGHVFVMNNCFMLVGLFEKLALNETCATKIMGRDRIGIL